MFQPAGETFAPRSRSKATRAHVSTTSQDDQIRALLRAHRYDEAFDAVITMFAARILRLAVAMLGDRALAEDTVQDVMVRIWRALPSYRSEASVSTWIYAITRNRCLTVLKQQGAERSTSLEEPTARSAAEHTFVETPPASNRAEVEALLGTLPAAYRQALTLFYMEEQSYEEIARLLGIPIGTVKTHIHRARKMLVERYRRT